MTRQASTRGGRSRLRLGAVLLLSLATLAAVVVGVHTRASGGDDPYSAPEEPPMAAPSEYTIPFWAEVVGGDAAPSVESWSRLNDLSRSDLGSAAQDAAETAQRVAAADLTGTGRSAFPGYWPPTGEISSPCSTVDPFAASPTSLPQPGSGVYAKVLVAYTGTCDGPGAPLDLPSTVFVYLELVDDEWVPLREWRLPGAGIDAAAYRSPEVWELKSLSGCVSKDLDVSARIIVANAWEVLCRDAQSAGVPLRAYEGYRSPADQQQLFEEGVEHYGSEEEARRRLAYSDGTFCTSRHCSGMAIDVEDGVGRSWLMETVGCVQGGEVVLGSSSCPAGVEPVRRLQRYGFAATTPDSPGHLEFVLSVPTDGSQSASDCNPQSSSIPLMVASVFRCRLQESGFEASEVRRVTAEALVVSRCASGWNPSALAYQGRFATEPDPLSGERYDGAGVFLLSAALADEWVEGGALELSDPVANVNAAASLYLAQRNWSSFGCATGASSGFGAGPVLPQYGGPPLPAWAFDY